MTNPFLLKPEEAGPDSNIPDNPLTDQSQPDESMEAQFKAGGLAALAEQDTSAIQPLADRAAAILARTEKFILTEAEDVATLKAALAEKMQANRTLNGLQLAEVRNHVQTLMVTLRAKPEFAGILLDEDVANLVDYARQCYFTHQEVIGVKSIRQEKRSNSSASKRAKSNASKANAFSDLMDDL